MEGIELRPVSADPYQYLKSEDPDTRDGEISESGWTIYSDDCVDNYGHKNTTSQFDVDQQQKKSSRLLRNIQFMIVERQEFQAMRRILPWLPMLRLVLGSFLFLCEILSLSRGCRSLAHIPQLR
jgi:hypothetical protein